MATAAKPKSLASNPALRRYEDVRELVASPANPTPMVRINGLVAPGRFELYLKLGWYNPFGSIKDRPALSMLRGMAERGELDGKELVEPSSDNTGIALTGIGRYLREQDPRVKVIAVKPQKGHRLPGMKNLEESRPPGILDRSVIDEVVRINDEPAYETTKRLYREEGLIVGPTSGAIVHAAVEFAKENEGLAVAIAPDRGLKYTSYFAEILGEEGMPKV